MLSIDRWIWLSWRAFWVGLGASAVLIAQALAVPHGATTGAASPAAPPTPALESPHPKARSADPILRRNAFDSKTGPLVAHPLHKFTSRG